MKDAPKRVGMGYFDPDCATVEVDLGDSSLQAARGRGPTPSRSVPPPLPARAHSTAPAASPVYGDAHAQALAHMSHLQQLQLQQQMQLQQMQQLQMQQQQQPVAQTARSVVDPVQAQNENDNRLKFLLFGLAIGAVVVLLLSGNGLSNLRARLAYALMPDAPAAAPVAPVALPAAVAAAPVAPPPTAIPVVTDPPPAPVAVAPAAPRTVPEVDVAHLPKSGRGSRVARKSMPTEIPASQAGLSTAPPPPPPVVDEPEEPTPPADPGIELKAFQALGKAFKTD